MFMNRKTQHLVRSPEVWVALVAPVRAEILEALRLLGPCTIAELANTLGRPADSLYRHLEILQQAGAVVDAGFRKGARNVEQLFDVVADDFAIDFHDGAGAAENQAIVATANSFLKAMARAVRDSAAARQLEFRPEQRNITINYELGWLTPEAFQKIRELVRQMKAIMDEGKKNRQGRLYMTLTIATPVTRKRGAGARAGSASPKQKSTKENKIQKKPK
jgi:DNA-binding transcriptional ArsR family regulator